MACCEETEKTTMNYSCGLGFPGMTPGLGAMPICGIPGAIIPGLGAIGGIPMGGIPIGGIPIGGIPIGIPLGIP